MAQSPPAKKHPTIADVAQRAGASISTVSRAFSGRDYISPAKREAVLKAARELGFEVNPHAQRLAQGYGHDNIGIFTLNLDLDIGTRLLQVIQRQLMDTGFEVAVHGYGSWRSHEKVEQGAILAALRRQRPRAVICTTVGLSAEALAELRRYQEEGGLVVCYHHPVAEDFEQVVFDEEENTYRATRHLLELGHRHLGFCHHGNDKPQHPQLRGFRRACAEFGAPLREDRVFHGGLYEENGAQLAQQFLDLEERPTAIYVANEHAAAAFINEVARAGLRVPEAVSAVSHGDMPAARYCAVPLTTVSCPVEKIAQHVVEMTLSRIEGCYSGPPRRVVVSGELIVRRSTNSPASTRERDKEREGE